MIGSQYRRIALVCFMMILSITNVAAQGMGDMDEDEYGGGGDGGYGGAGGGDPYGGYGGEGGPPKGSPSSAKVLSSVDELKSFIAEATTEPVVIGFFDPTTNNADQETFEEVASSSIGELVRFALTTTKEVLEEFKYDGCAVLVYKPKDSLEKFIYDKSTPLVGAKTEKSGDRLDKLKIPVVTLFAEVDTDKNIKQWQYYANRLRKIAQDYKNKIIFEIASASDYSHILPDYDISLESRKDIGVGIKAGKMYYHMEETYSPESVKSFVEAFLAGGLVGKEKKAPPSHDEDPSDDVDDSNVVNLTDANFDEEVTNADKDVLLEFYAPWCGHCKSLKPTYAQLANKLKDVPTVTIAAMDATASTVPKGYEVSGYPTIMFVSAKNKKPISYDGARDADSMAAWIKDHASHPFSL
eukprot:gene10780-22506_t